MFTGIIKELGEVVRIERRGPFQRMEVRAQEVLEHAKPGDSINIDGACQTIVDLNDRHFTIESVAETLKLTTLGSLNPGDFVNLEPAIRPTDRLGGHLLTGHVDGVGEITRRQQQASSTMLTVKIADQLKRYVVPKGSIAVDGISLTVVSVSDTLFTVSIIPYTWQNTTIHLKPPGAKVNIETDILAKYVAKLIECEAQPKMTQQWLQLQGF
ncbi:MAG: riboflavin synthase [Candidatus Latescibacteria bacterium]|nr:riboflavin synthase [Candidatus Latescibacterota bacterium]